ncbi:hypothetical protein ETAE_1857 [Edwardsiella piscicida]|uniref:Uncharacterized protein n=1 Tax=Edwardsiella piscicida TaxID=1263550 RepID=A0AAU8P3S6_EDWPI|nr:hypothetical protein ETAE_1857 [Edwardsiella tarda EIB202]
MQIQNEIKHYFLLYSERLFARHPPGKYVKYAFYLNKHNRMAMARLF